MGNRRKMRIRISAVITVIAATIITSVALISQPVQASSDEEVMKKP